MTGTLLFLFACIVLVLLFITLVDISAHLADIRSELRTLNERKNHENRPRDD